MGTASVSEPSDTQAMEALRDGDDDALAIIVERYQNELVGYFYNHCWDQLVAEELAQTVFVKVFRARARYRPTAKVRTFLYRIAHNAWIDHLRRRKPQVSLDAEMGSSGLTLAETMAHGGPGPSEDRQHLIRRRVREAVEQLPEGQRDVFLLANNQDLRYQVISEVLGIPEGTVKSRMHAAVRNLRKLLGDLLESEDVA